MKGTSKKGCEERESCERQEQRKERDGRKKERDGKARENVQG